VSADLESEFQIDIENSFQFADDPVDVESENITAYHPVRVSPENITNTKRPSHGMQCDVHSSPASNEQHSASAAFNSTFQMGMEDKIPVVGNQLDLIEDNITNKPPQNMPSNHNVNSPNLPSADPQLPKLELSPSSKQCMFFEEIVSVGPGGYVQIASPPKLPLEGILKCYRKCNNCLDTAILTPSIEANNITGITETDTGNRPRYRMSPEKKENFLPVSPGCVVASTPEEKILTRTHKTFQHVNFEDVNYYSPRLCSLADQGIVPSSPGLDVPSISSPVVEATCFMLNDAVLNTVRCSVVPEKESQDRNSDTDISKRLSAVNIIDADEDISAEVLVHDPNGLKPTILQTPTIHQSVDESSSWMKPLDASSTVQKAKKFRRLRKLKDGNKKSPHRSGQPGKRSGKQRLKFEAAKLIDEEAE
jgi:hypothetical protein